MKDLAMNLSRPAFLLLLATTTFLACTFSQNIGGSYEIEGPGDIESRVAIVNAALVERFKDSETMQAELAEHFEIASEDIRSVRLTAGQYTSSTEEGETRRAILQINVSVAASLELDPNEIVEYLSEETGKVLRPKGFTLKRFASPLGIFALARNLRAAAQPA